MDEQKNFLRHPLTVESGALLEPGTLMEELIIIGGASFEVARLIEQIKGLVQNHCCQISTIRILLDLRHLEMSTGTTVLSLTSDGSWGSLLDNARLAGGKPIYENDGRCNALENPRGPNDQLPDTGL